MHFGNIGAAQIAHAGAQAAHQLVDDVHNRAFIRHAAFDALGHVFVGAVLFVLEIAVGRALAHRAQRAHAAVGFVGAALIELDFARCFVGACKHAAQHHGGGACGQGFGHVAGEADAAVGNQRHAGALERFGHVVNRRQLRHAHAGHDAGGANRARADAHFHRVCPGRHQIACRLCGGDVAADNLHLREVCLHPTHPIQNTLAVAVCGIHHNHVHPGSHQSGHAFVGFRTHAHRRAHAQAAVLVFVGMGEFGGFQNIAHRNQAFELVLRVHNQNALDLMLMHQFARVFNAGAFGHGNQFGPGRHDGGHRLVEAGFKAQIAVGNQAHQLAVLHHRQAGHLPLTLCAHFQQLANQHFRRNRYRVFHHAAFVPLHFGHGLGLALDAHVLMNDADAAFLRHGNGQARLGNGVHGGGNQGQVEGNVAGEAGLQRDVLGQHLGMGGNKQYIIKGVGFFNDSHD